MQTFWWRRFDGVVVLLLAIGRVGFFVVVQFDFTVQVAFHIAGIVLAF
jgi:hypothetical protein